jgi:hypothetical protein
MPKTQSKELELQVRVQLKNQPDGSLERISRDLHNELRDLRVEISPEKGGPAPGGSKSVELAMLGAWILKMAPEVLPSLLGLLKDWIKRQPSAPLKVTVKHGNKNVTIEYDPSKSSLADVEAMTRRLLSAK